MFKLKKHYCLYDYPWNRGHYWLRWGYFRGNLQVIGEFRAGVALKQERREERLHIKGRVRKGYDILPNPYDDIPISRSGLRSWKDISRKRKQWE